ncbi:MAG: ComF family protein [Hyphomicrobiales bacterium]
MEEFAEASGTRGPDLAAMARRAGRVLLDLIVPPRCLSCGAAVEAPHTLCARCWSRLRLIERPYCERLGTPFPFDPGPGALSSAAIASPPAFDRARAVAVFDEVARGLVHDLKYRDRGELSVAMGRWMARAGAELVAGADLLVPVPLHRRRLFQRRYNQSALLARAVAAASGVAVSVDSLERIKQTRQQVGLSARDRAANVRGAFVVPAAHRIDIAGRNIVLVDDVLTSGATVEAATRALRRAGAARVDVLVFARVVGGEAAAL